LLLEILFVAFCVVCVASFAFFSWLAIKQLEDERAEWRDERHRWNQERSILLDRIQSSSFIEFKSQERGEMPIKRREKDELTKKMESEPWA